MTVAPKPPQAPASVGSTLTLFRRDRAEVLGELDEIPARLANSSLLWVDLHRPSEAEVQALAERLGFDEETAAMLCGRASGPAFRDGGAFVQVTAHAPGGGDLQDEPRTVVCVVGKSWVVTSHDRAIPVLDEFAQRASGSGPTGELDGPRFLAALLEWMLNEYATAFEQLEEELEELDTRAMRGDGRQEEAIGRLVDLRVRTGRLRRSLVAYRSALLVLAHPELEALGDEESARRFALVLERYEATLQSARDTRESVVSSFDVLLARTGHRTNEIVKVLTLASVIFLPGRCSSTFSASGSSSS